MFCCERVRQAVETESDTITPECDIEHEIVYGARQTPTVINFACSHEKIAGRNRGRFRDACRSNPLQMTSYRWNRIAFLGVCCSMAIFDLSTTAYAGYRSFRRSLQPLSVKCAMRYLG